MSSAALEGALASPRCAPAAVGLRLLAPFIGHPPGLDPTPRAGGGRGPLALCDVRVCGLPLSGPSFHDLLGRLDQQEILDQALGGNASVTPGGFADAIQQLQGGG